MAAKSPPPPPLGYNHCHSKNKKMSQKGKKFHKFLDPRMIMLFSNLGKIGFLAPPPRTLFGKNLKLRKF